MNLVPPLAYPLHPSLAQRDLYFNFMNAFASHTGLVSNPFATVCRTEAAPATRSYVSGSGWTSADSKLVVVLLTPHISQL